MFQDKITKNIAAEVSKIKTEVKEVEVNENSVEGSASKIMGEELKGNQHKIDANNNNKIDAHDFKLLRAKKKVQETTDTPGNSYEHQCALHVKSEQFGEGRTLFSQHAEPDSDGNIEWYDVMFEEGIKRVNTEDLEILVSESHGNHKKKMKESVELDEVKMSDLPSRKIEGKSYGATTKQGNPFDVLKGPKETDLKKIEKEKKKKSFSEMIQQYNETGLKTIQEWSNKEVSEESEQIEEGERSGNYIGTVHKSDPDYDKKLSDLKSRAIGGHRIRGRSPAPEHKEKYQEGGELKRPHQDIKPEHATRVDVYGRKGVKSVSEETEQIDELSKDTLQNYTQKAKAVSKNAKAYGSYNADPDDSDLADKNWKKHEKLEKGIMKAKEKMNKEEVEQIDELSKSTLGSYVNKASRDASTSKAASANWAHTSTKAKNPRVKDAAAKYSDEEEARHNKRMTGIGQAVKKITKEESELDEREMTDAEMEKREEIVKSMKKGMKGFKDRYGDRAKNVMYATAAKIAKEKA